MSSSSPLHQRKKLDAGRRWKDVPSKRLETTAKVERDRIGTMNCSPKPTQPAGEPEAAARARVPSHFRRLKWNEVVWTGDFVADERLELHSWEGPSGFRAGSFTRPIYRQKETESFRPASTRKHGQHAKHR